MKRVAYFSLPKFGVNDLTLSVGEELILHYKGELAPHWEGRGQYF